MGNLTSPPNLAEGKFIFNTSVGTRVRTFCSNPSGHVVVENHSGVMAANGHSYKDPALGSNNTNFALLVSHKFTEPFDKPNEYARGRLQAYTAEEMAQALQEVWRKPGQPASGLRVALSIGKNKAKAYVTEAISRQHMLVCF